jgi:hypothetical protein
MPDIIKSRADSLGPGATERFVDVTGLNEMAQQVVPVGPLGGPIGLAIADGADVTQGAIADAAVNTDAPGTINGHLRGLLERMVNFLSRLPTALGAHDALKVEGVAGGVAVPVSLATAPALVAGEAHIGEVGGHGFSIPVTLTVTNGAYTIGDVVGGLTTLPAMVRANGKHAYIDTVTLAGVVAIAYELHFFTANIATPAADNAAFTLVAADEALWRGYVPIETADYKAAASAFNMACVRGVGLEVQAGAATTTLYAYLKATAVTSPGTTTLYLRVTGSFVD